MPEKEMTSEALKGRLRTQSEFTYVRSHGVSEAGRYCVVNILMAPPDAKRKAAFSISRRYSKLSVERNRARRLFREVYRRILEELPLCWIVFIPRHRMKDAKMEAVLEDVRSCSQRIMVRIGGEQKEGGEQ